MTVPMSAVDCNRLGQRAWLLALVLSAALLALVIASLGVGARAIAPANVMSVLVKPDASRESLVVWQLRMPRTALACLAGAALAVAGGLMQALSRNPLADPGLIGVNAGASFFVVLAISVFGITSFSAYVWFALLGAGLASAAVYVLSARANEATRRVRLVLAGIAVSASLGAMTGIITMLDTAAFDSFRFWVVGAVGGRDPAIIWQMAPLVGSGLLAGLALSGPLNAMAMGDDIGRALGLPLGLILTATFITIAILSGGATAAVGPISFVGLVVPHLLRIAVGPDWRRIVPLSLLAGPVLLLASDIIGRIVTPPGELEAGIVMAFIGSPMLLWLVQRHMRANAR